MDLLPRELIQPFCCQCAAFLKGNKRYKRGALPTLGFLLYFDKCHFPRGWMKTSINKVNKTIIAATIELREQLASLYIRALFATVIPGQHSRLLELCWRRL